MDAQKRPRTASPIETSSFSPALAPRSRSFSRLVPPSGSLRESSSGSAPPEGSPSLSRSSMRGSPSADKVHETVEQLKLHPTIRRIGKKHIKLPTPSFTHVQPPRVLGQHRRNYPPKAPLTLHQSVFAHASRDNQSKLSYNDETTEWFYDTELQNGSMLNIPLCDHNGTRISQRGCEEKGLSVCFVPRNASVTLNLCFDGKEGLAFVCESKELSMPLP